MQRNLPVLEDILQKARNGYPISREETGHLLTLQDSESIERLMSTARALRKQHFGNKIFFYGFIYLSTYCRNQCAFCFYRRPNTRSPRYRRSLTEVVDVTYRLVDAGVHLVDLTLGEDPRFYETGDFRELFHIVRAVKEQTGIPIMVSPGMVPDEVLNVLFDLGVDWYALYQETHNRKLFQKLRIGQDFEERCAKRASAKHDGMLVEDGILIGVGETISDRADSILSMKQDGVHQARVMSFIPQPDTPFAARPSPPRLNECLCIAAMRLAMPDRLIPASLDVDGIKGLQMRLEAGANVVTSIIPPHSMLAGVARCSLDVEQGRRTVDEVKKILAGIDLLPAGREDYESWVTSRKKTLWTEHDAPSKINASGRLNRI
jgi:methylornithine synthase